MTPKHLYAALAVVTILILLGFGFVLLRMSGKIPQGCIDFDGFCPKGCNFELDADCPRQQVMQAGAIFSCITDADCLIVNTICNNKDCVYFDDKCRYGTECFTAINKDYKNIWTPEEVQCAGTPLPINCTTNLSVKCIKGACQLQGA